MHYDASAAHSHMQITCCGQFIPIFRFGNFLSFVSSMKLITDFMGSCILGCILSIYREEYDGRRRYVLEMNSISS